MEIGDFVTDGEFTHDKNFAPKQNEKICPITRIITGQKLLSTFRAKFSASKLYQTYVKMSEKISASL